MLVGKRVYLDANPIIYALESPNQFPGLIAYLLTPLQAGTLIAVTNTITQVLTLSGKSGQIHSPDGSVVCSTLSEIPKNIQRALVQVLLPSQRYLNAEVELTGEQRAEREILRCDIAAAFDGVSRIGGTSWGEAQVDGEYGTFLGETFHDQDLRWQDLLDDPEWDCEAWTGGFAFLDSIGLRYYLPAAMIRALDQLDHIGEMELIDQHGATGALALWPGHEAYMIERWAMITAPQRECIRRFIEFKRTLPDGFSFDEQWDYWTRGET